MAGYFGRGRPITGINTYTKTQSDDRFRDSISGDMLPDSDDTRDLGSSSKAWAKIYTEDLNVGSAVESDLIPDSDDTRDLGSSSKAWAEAYVNNLTVAGNDIATAGSLSNRNKIINGSMLIAQRGTNFSGGTTNADDAYTLDRWYVLSEGSDSVDVDQIADSPDDGGKCIRLDVETTGEKFGIAQIVEASNCTGLIGNTVTLSFAAKVSNARIDTVKAAVVAWSGTADTVTSDIISSWGADGTTPTLITNATFENTPADLGVTTSWATYEITAAVDTASTANLIVFIWSDDATNPLAGDFLYLTNVQLEAGDTATPFEHRSYGQELALCQRYYSTFRSQARSASAGFMATPYYLPVKMRATPTLTQISAGSANLASIQGISSVYDTGGYFQINVTGANGYVLGAIYSASAEL